MTPAEHLAKLFHETYEALAPQYGYETRKETAKPWEAVPESNRLLMIATCNSILANDKAPRGRIEQLEAERDAAVSTARVLRSDADDETGALAAELSIAYNALATARQSRARLVGAVREQRELLKAARLIRAELRKEVADLTTEADAARAWAAAWKRAATWWRGAVHYMALGGHVNYGKASRKRRAAAEAAEAMERR